MKKLFIAVLLLVMSSTLVWADEFRDIVYAYQKQGYKTASPLLINAAQQAHVDVRINFGVAYDDA